MITKKEWLEQPGQLSRRMAYHAERLLTLRREADAVASRWGESIRAQCAEAPYVRMLERIETMQEKLKWENELYDRLRSQVEEAINGLPQEKMRLVLLYHYLEGRSFQQIGDLLYMDKGTANRWAVRALEFLILPEDPVTIDAENCNECLRVPADATPASMLQ